MKRREWALAFKNGSLVGCLRVLFEKSSSFVFETFKTGLPLIIMGYQLFEGWSSAEAAQKSSQGPTPPPPEPLKVSLFS